MKSVVVAVYMGALPTNLPLWLASCGRNSTIDWLLVTDQDVGDKSLPGNVSVRHETLESLASLFSNHVGFEVALTSPYKLNDLKPLFFKLVSNIGEYDYWGYCDLDVQFGSLASLCEEHFGASAMILSEGHLRFIRNEAGINNLYRRIAVPRSWTDILRDPANFGMDEHHGINGAFKASGLPVFANPALVADIDPSFRQFRLLPQYRNYRIQAFAYEDGHVFREYRHRGRYGRDEFLYIHFQKRRLVNHVPADSASFFITPEGFVPRAPGESDARTIARVNPWRRPNREEIMRVLRMRVRMIVRRDDLYSSILPRRAAAR